MSVIDLEKMDTWRVIVEAAKIRSYEPVLELPEAKFDGIGETDKLPRQLHYHRDCYQRFTMKTLLNRIKQKFQAKRTDEKRKQEELESLIDSSQTYVTSNTVTLRSSSSITSNSAGSPILPNICIICDKKNRYVKKKSEKMRQCLAQKKDSKESCIQKTLEKFSNERQDFRIQSLLSTTDLIAAEAKYHPTCYMEYTRPKGNKNNKQQDMSDYKKNELEAFHIVVTKCHEMMYNQTILKLVNLTNMMKDFLSKKGIEISISTKKNLRRNIENTFGKDVLFTNVKNNVLLYPQSMIVDAAILALCKEDDDEKIISKVASIIRNEVKEMKDELPWPPQPADLEPEKFVLPRNLDRFLTNLFAAKEDQNLSSRNATIKYSIGQDIIYNLTSGRVKTPKSVLLPSVIKTLTNNTEIINILNRLGHGISYSILSEMNTENAYRIQEQQLGEVVIPEDVMKELFSIYVADNIDRTEETLTGKLFSICITHLYC